MYMSVSNALAGQRASKKRAEDDVKLLANRLALLKLEEKKVSQFIFALLTAWGLYLAMKVKSIALQMSVKFHQSNWSSRNGPIWETT